MLVDFYLGLAILVSPVLMVAYFICFFVTGFYPLNRTNLYGEEDPNLFAFLVSVIHPSVFCSRTEVHGGKLDV